jgi:cell shape-determining protein MreD
MLVFAFFLATLALFLQAAVFPSISFFPFAPWIALVILKMKRSTELWKPLWLTALAGLFTDLFSDHPLGLHAITFCLTSAALFPWRTHFLYERPLHFALFTALASFVCTPLQLFFLFLFDRRVPFAGKWALGDGLVMPLADGLLAALWFAAPLFLFSKTTRLWKIFWIKKNISPT